MKTLYISKLTAFFVFLLLLQAGCTPESSSGTEAQNENPTEEGAEETVANSPAKRAAVNKPASGDTKTFVLTDTDISFELPASFKVSDRSRIKQDIPAMQEDPLLLAPLQGGIDDLRSEDDFPDLFVDTGSRYRFFLVHNFEHLDLDQQVQGAIEKYLDKRMDFLAKLMKEIEIQRKGIQFFELDDQNRFQVRYLFTDKSKPEHFIWLTMYFIATESQSYYILVASDTDDDMEAYVNTLKEG
ncbi:MAG TPA: hypothetical protein ENJ88_00590 [Phaeodactylibacter sp.]|nr:hypothetical protein [Phaeodactylibacter sp.]